VVINRHPQTGQGKSVLQKKTKHKNDLPDPKGGGPQQRHRGREGQSKRFFARHKRRTVSFKGPTSAFWHAKRKEGTAASVDARKLAKRGRSDQNEGTLQLIGKCEVRKQHEVRELEKKDGIFHFVPRETQRQGWEEERPAGDRQGREFCKKNGNGSWAAAIMRAKKK